MTTELLIGSTAAEHLSIRVLGREHAGADDYWDGNWVIAAISIAAGGFTGQVRASLRTDELRLFHHGLTLLQQNLSGTAALESMEEWITVNVTAEPRGRVGITGELADQAGVGNVLTFELPETDQTSLAAWILSLEEIERAFPVIGTS